MTKVIIVLLLCAFHYGSNSIKLFRHNRINSIGEYLRSTIFDHDTIDHSKKNRQRRNFDLKSTSETQSQTQAQTDAPPVNVVDPQTVRREYVPRKYVSGSKPIEANTSPPTTLESSITSDDASATALPAGPRIYKPKLATSKFTEAAAAASSSSISNTEQRPKTQQTTSSYAGSGRGSYSPRSSSSSSSYSAPSYSGAGGGVGGRSQDGTVATQLVNPFLVVRFRIPREKTEFKKQLEEMQTTFTEQAEANRGSQSSYGSSYSRGSGGGGGGGGGRDAFFDNFAPPSSSEFSRRGGSAKGKAGSGKEKETDFEKTKSNRRAQSGLEDDEIDIEDLNSDSYSSASMSAVIEDSEDEEDYYGEGSNFGLQDVPAGALQNMESEGYTLEEMQMSLYGEYGIKVSMNSLKRRLADDKSERKGKKRTGKTRREKTKARNLRFNPVKEQQINLAEYQLIQVQELAQLMDVGAGELIRHLMINMGMMATMTQSIEVSVAKQLVIAFGKKLVEQTQEQEDAEEAELARQMKEAADMAADLDSSEVRAPVVTIMGHVDHGKTSLLDRIRSTKVAQGEAGGITQGISAFSVLAREDKRVTFLDTPGHAAFREMRKRGANMTDIVILVVAADDGVMEQTKECIAAAQASNCPIIVAINKIDKEGAEPERVKTDLMSYNVLIEEFGGESQCVEISAKKGLGIEDLLDKVLLQAEIMNLKSFPEVPTMGSVIEARVDKGLGVVVTALVQKGTLKVGDLLLCGPAWGRVRRLLNDQGKEIKEAGPSTPVQIVGLSNVPNAGDVFTLTDNEADTREVAEARQRLLKQAMGSASSNALLAQAAGFAGGTIDTREVLKLPVLIKGDVAGSVEALRSSIEALQQEDETTVCRPDIVFCGVGDVTSSDVSIAQVSKAKIIAFNVAAGYNAMEDARALNVEIGYYNVVYELLEELEKKVKVTLSPPPPGVLVGRAEVKKLFKIGKGGKVAGCLVTEGFIKTDSNVRVLRGKRNVVYTGTISSLKVVRDEAKEVPEGSECGLALKDFADLEEGDVVECFSAAAAADLT